MARYSVAATRNNLSSLIDKALAGEEVVITRHGRPTVSIKAVSEEPNAECDPAVNIAKRLEWDERLAKLRASMPRLKLSYLETKRLEQADYEH